MISIFPKANSAGGLAPKEIFTGIRIDYKRDCKFGFGEGCVGDDERAELPAANYLFEIDESSDILDNNDKGNLHSSISKAL